MSSEQSVEVWSPDSFKGKVEERIREIFMDIIPPEAFKQMVSTAVDDFSKPRRVNEGSEQYPRYVTKPSALETIVTDLMQEEVKRCLKATMADPAWGVDYDGTIGKHVSKLVSENADELVHALITRAFGSMLYEMKNNV